MMTRLTLLALLPFAFARILPRSNQTVTPNASCGPTNGFSCLGSPWGNCCGFYGWCGSTDTYCGSGCQPAYGNCGTNTGSATTLIDTQFPHRIIYLDQDNPNTANGQQMSGHIRYNTNGADQIQTEILFDVPNNAATECHINFNLAPNNQVPWTIGGPGPYRFDVYRLTQVPGYTDTWNNHAPVGDYAATIELFVSGPSAVVTGGVLHDCGQGTHNFLLKGAPSAGSFDITWFEQNVPLNGITFTRYK